VRWPIAGVTHLSPTEQVTSGYEHTFDTAPHLAEGGARSVPRSEAHCGPAVASRPVCDRQEGSAACPFGAIDDEGAAGIYTMRRW